MVTAGSNITITGSGSAANPYVVSSTLDLLVADTATVDLSLIGDTLSADVKLDPVAGNLIVDTANGLRLDCAGISSCLGGNFTAVDTPTLDLTLTGAGTAASPWVLSGTSLMQAITIDPAAGNILTQSGAGVLADIQSGCGLSGEGTIASPLIVDTGAGAWPFTCAEGLGAKVYCDPVSGDLHVDPPLRFIDVYTTNHVIGVGTALGPNVSIDNPALPQVGEPAEEPFGPIVNFNVTNPSTCRSMRVRLEVGISHYELRAKGDGRTNFLVGARLQASGGIALAPTLAQNHQIWLHDGSDVDADVGWDTTSSNYIATLFTVAPGASTTFTLQATARIINFTNSSTTIGDLEIFTRVTGYNI